MNELSERLRWARLRSGFTQRKLAASLEVSTAAVAYWEAGVKMPGRDRAMALATLLGVRLEWLLKGSGSPEATPNAALTEKIGAASAAIRGGESFGEGKMEGYREALSDLAAGKLRVPDQPRELPWYEYTEDVVQHRVVTPLFSAIAAGQGKEVEPCGAIHIVNGMRGLHALRVCGDSMAPGIVAGDVVLCKPLAGEGRTLPPLGPHAPRTPVDLLKAWVKPRGIYVLAMNDEAPTLKRVQIARAKGTWHLVISADNPHANGWPYVVTREDRVHFWSEAVALGRQKPPERGSGGRQARA